MNSHELARLLLSLPDLPVALYAMGHTYTSDKDARSHGPLQVATCPSDYRDHRVLVIGHMFESRRPFYGNENEFNMLHSGRP